MPPVILGSKPAQPQPVDLVAIYTIAISKTGGGNVGAQGHCTPENDFRACCTLLHGSSQRCSDPVKFIDEVVDLVKKRLLPPPVDEPPPAEGKEAP